jgi:hypothetical protein
MEDNREEIKTYITKTINVFIEPLVYTLAKKRPQDPVSFALKWLTDYASKNKSTSPDTDSESDETEHVALLEEKIQKKKAQGKKKSRLGISEEVFGSFNKK